MNIDKALISKLESLTRLQLTEEERLQLEVDLTAILQMVEKMNDLDTSGVEPLTHITSELNRWREDRVEEALDREMALKNAPDREGPFFRVPKVIELDDDRPS